jgi:hypothetical protein
MTMAKPNDEFDFATIEPARPVVTAHDKKKSVGHSDGEDNDEDEGAAAPGANGPADIYEDEDDAEGWR